MPAITVAAGVLHDASGRILIAQRPEAAHAGGFWEFPGGKIQPGESPVEALARELREEIGVEVEVAIPLVTYTHAHPDRIVELHVFTVQAYRGEARGLEGQPLRWVEFGELAEVGLLEADAPIVEALSRSRA